MDPRKLDCKTLAAHLGVDPKTLHSAQILRPQDQPLELCYALSALVHKLDRDLTPANLHPLDAAEQEQLFQEICDALGWSDRKRRQWNGRRRGHKYAQQWFRLVTAAVYGGYPPVTLPEPFTRAHRMYDDGMRLSYAEKRPAEQRSKYRNYRTIVLADGSTVFRRK